MSIPDEREVRVAAVLRMLQGQDATAVADDLGRSASELVEWRDRFVAGGRAAVVAAGGTSEGDERAAMLQALIDASPDYLFAKDTEYRYVAANLAYAASLGVRPEDLVGRTDTTFWQPVSVFGDGARGFPGFRASDDRALAGHEVHDPAVRASRDGETHTYVTHKVPFRGADGTVRGVLIHARDVTEPLRTEEALRTSETRYRLLVEHAPVAVYVHDGTTILFTNRAFVTMLGATEATEVVGRSLASLVHPDDRARVRERVRDLSEGKIATPIMDGRFVGVDERVVHVQVMATRCEFEGRPAIQVVAIDMSERRRAEQERVTLEAQLRHAQRLEALGTLAGGIAHDFNNMLAVITANVALASDDIGPDHPASPSLGEVAVAAHRASELVRGILAFGRKHPVRREPLRPSAVVHELLRLLRATLPAAIELRADIDDDEPRVMADATQMNQALMNLCTNAWQSIGEDAVGCIRIAVRRVDVGAASSPVHPELVAGAYARVSVSDTGSGIEPAILDRIFDPFFTTKTSGRGTGLGLSVVHGIMKAHNGTVTLSTELGEGTTFHLFFPVAEDAGAVAAPAPAQALRGHGAGRRILLVDDEAAVLSIMRRLLERLGFRVSAHPTAGAALAELRSAPGDFDLVLTDLDMPGSTGLDVAEEAARVRPELPVVLITGYLNDEMRRRSEELGVRALLAKPVPVEELGATLDELALRRG